MSDKDTITYTARSDVPRSWISQLIELLFPVKVESLGDPTKPETISDGSKWDTWEVEVEDTKPR